MNRCLIRLKSVEIRGFKSISFQNPLKLDFGDVTILLGANGAGKSNIISFFKMVDLMMRGSLQRFIAEYGTNQKFLYYGAKKTPEMSALISFSEDNRVCGYSFSLKAAVPDRLIISSEELKCTEEDGKEILKKKIHADFNESALVNSFVQEEIKFRALLSGCKVFQFSDSSLSSPMRQASAVDSAHYLQSNGENLASFLYYLKNNYPEAFQRITEYVREVVPQFHNFYLEPVNGYVSLKWTDTSANDYVLSADQFSDGSIRFIALTTLLLQPRETMPLVIIVDEPELGLHPYAIDQLNQMIMDAACHAQIVVATQSTAIIDGFSANDVIVIERDPSSECTLAKRLPEDDYRDWLEEYTLSELWNKNVIGGRPV